MSVRKQSLVKVGLIQTRVSADLPKNLRQTVRRIREAAANGAQVICLQELYKTKYFPTDEKAEVKHLAETIPGESTEAFSSLAKELNVVIVAPVFEAAKNGRFYNSAAVIDADGTLLGAYRKIHIPHDPFFYEKSYFEPGDRGYMVFNTRHLRFAVLICYDQWFPEAARMASLEGADLIFYPTAIGYLKGDPLPHSDWLSAWLTIQRSHALANFVHVAAVNRVGTEGPVTFWGNSFVANPFGKILKKAGDKEGVLVAEVDISQNSRIREGWRFTKNRRPETYDRISAPLVAETPKREGLRMPAEWEPHEATWLAWPHDPVTFPKRLPKVREQYVRIIEALHHSEDVHLAVTGEAMKSSASAMLKAAGVNLRRVQFHIWDYADVWFRDYGPTFVVNRETKRSAIVQWRFNAWGNKYPDLVKDGNVPYYISERIGVPLFMPGVVLEGGAIDVNGAGTLLTTEQCVLNENRNPPRSKRDFEKYVDDYLGVRHTVWLKHGIAGDDTDGHIDNLARFVNPTTVLCAYEDDKQDENFAALKANYDLLRRAKDQDGQPLSVIRLPMPPAKYDVVRGEKRRLSSSYMNFYIANEVVLVPTFQSDRDAIALERIQSAFPDREIVGIDCSDVIYGAGTLHCISQQQPRL